MGHKNHQVGNIRNLMIFPLIGMSLLFGPVSWGQAKKPLEKGQLIKTKASNKAGVESRGGTIHPEPSSTESSGSTSLRASKPNLSWEDLVHDRLQVGGIISTANVLAVDDASVNAIQQKLKGGMDLNTSTAIGVNLQYVQDVGPIPFLALGGLTIENYREVESLRGFGSTFIPESRPSFQPWIVHVGASYRLNRYLSFPVALNYTVLNFKRDGSFKAFEMKPEPGYQFGVIFQPNARFGFELQQRELRYRSELQTSTFKADLGLTRLAGLNLIGRYHF